MRHARGFDPRTSVIRNQQKNGELRPPSRTATAAASLSVCARFPRFFAPKKNDFLLMKCGIDVCEIRPSKSVRAKTRPLTCLWSGQPPSQRAHAADQVRNIRLIKQRKYVKRLAAEIAARGNAVAKISMVRPTARHGDRRARSLYHAEYICYEMRH